MPTLAMRPRRAPPPAARHMAAGHYCAPLPALQELRLPAPQGRSVMQLLQRHDFSSARAALLGSVPGRHSGAVLHAWG